MPIDEKGQEILKRIGYHRFRQAIIDSIMNKISVDGISGCNLRPILEETLKDEHFSDLVKKIAKEIELTTNMNRSESEKSASYLIEQELGSDIAQNLKEPPQDKPEEEPRKKDKVIQRKGLRARLWKGTWSDIFLGRKSIFVVEIVRILGTHPILRIIILMGIAFLIISSILFNSVYKAVLVGLTLTAYPGESLRLKAANLIGGMGGVLVFFTAVSILVQFFLITRSRDEHIRELARKCLQESRTKEPRDHP